MRFALFTILLLAVSVCEGQKPDKQQYLLKKADSLYHLNDYKKAASDYNKAFNLIANKGYSLKGYSFNFYNAASANAHAKNLSKAFICLNEMVTRDNLTSKALLSIDSNFIQIHNNRQWEHLMDLITSNKDEFENKYGKAITRELIEINFQTLHQKTKIDSLINIYGYKSKEADKEKILAGKNDSLNFLRVKSIINAYGWLGPDVIGNEANQDMFNAIFNTRYNNLKKYVPIVWEAFLKGDATANNYAAIADKVALIESKAQIYGSIVNKRGAIYYIPPIIDEQNVNNRRAKIGLPPLGEYLKQYGLDYTNP